MEPCHRGLPRAACWIEPVSPGRLSWLVTARVGGQPCETAQIVPVPVALDFRTFGLAEGCHRGPVQGPARSRLVATSGTVLKGGSAWPVLSPWFARAA